MLILIVSSHFTCVCVYVVNYYNIQTAEQVVVECMFVCVFYRREQRIPFKHRPTFSHDIQVKAFQLSKFVSVGRNKSSKVVSKFCKNYVSGLVVLVCVRELNQWVNQTDDTFNYDNYVFLYNVTHWNWKGFRRPSVANNHILSSSGSEFLSFSFCKTNTHEWARTLERSLQQDGKSQHALMKSFKRKEGN